MDRTQRILEAWVGSEEAFARVRRMREMARNYEPRAAIGHMPFPGHRDQATIRRIQTSAAARHARAFGYEGPWG